MDLSWVELVDFQRLEQLEQLLDTEKDLSGKVVLVEEVLKQQLDGLEGQKFGVEEQLRQLDEIKLRQLWKTGHWWN